MVNQLGIALRRHPIDRSSGLFYLFYFILFYFILFYFILFYFILFYFIFFSFLFFSFLFFSFLFFSFLFFSFLFFSFILFYFIFFFHDVPFFLSLLSLSLFFLLFEDDPKVVRDIIFPAGCNVIVDMKVIIVLIIKLIINVTICRQSTQWG